MKTKRLMVLLLAFMLLFSSIPVSAWWWDPVEPVDTPLVMYAVEDESTQVTSYKIVEAMRLDNGVNVTYGHWGVSFNGSRVSYFDESGFKQLTEEWVIEILEKDKVKSAYSLVEVKPSSSDGVLQVTQVLYNDKTGSYAYVFHDFKQDTDTVKITVEFTAREAGYYRIRWIVDDGELFQTEDNRLKKDKVSVDWSDVDNSLGDITTTEKTGTGYENTFNIGWLGKDEHFTLDPEVNVGSQSASFFGANIRNIGYWGGYFWVTEIGSDTERMLIKSYYEENLTLVDSTEINQPTRQWSANYNVDKDDYAYPETEPGYMYSLIPGDLSSDSPEVIRLQMLVNGSISTEYGNRTDIYAAITSDQSGYDGDIAVINRTQNVLVWNWVDTDPNDQQTKLHYNGEFEIVTKSWSYGGATITSLVSDENPVYSDSYAINSTHILSCSISDAGLSSRIAYATAPAVQAVTAANIPELRNATVPMPFDQQISTIASGGILYCLVGGCLYSEEDPNGDGWKGNLTQTNTGVLINTADDNGDLYIVYVKDSDGIYMRSWDASTQTLSGETEIKDDAGVDKGRLSAYHRVVDGKIVVLWYEGSTMYLGTFALVPGPTNISVETDGYSRNEYDFLNITIRDDNLLQDLTSVIATVNTSGNSENFTLQWIQATNVFSEVSDPDNICTLGTNSLARDINASYHVICFNLTITGGQSGSCDVNVTSLSDDGLTDTTVFTSAFFFTYFNWVDEVYDYINSAFEQFEIIDYMASITVFLDGLSTWFNTSLTRMVDLLVQQFRIITAVYDWFLYWTTAMIGIVLDFSTFYHELLDGTSAWSDALVPWWEFFMGFAPAFPLFGFIWWIDSLSSRAKQTVGGVLQVFLNDVNTAIGLLSYFFGVFSFVANTVIDRVYGLFDAIP